MKRTTRLTLLLALLFLVVGASESYAQEIKQVHGKACLVISDDMTRGEAIKECIKQARQEAIKDAFPEVISSITNMQDRIIDGEEHSQFVEDVSMTTIAEWIADTQKPAIGFGTNSEGVLMVNVEVWGEARRKNTDMVDFSWKILSGSNGYRYETNQFNNRQRMYINFRSPIDGYLAIYLLDSTNKEASCLLPYKTNRRGQFPIKGGREYNLFDKDEDPNAFHYLMTTRAKSEIDQVVVIFSPNGFTKCNEITGDRRHPNSLSIDDFEAWLVKLRRQDSDIVVDRTKYITITNKANNHY